MHYVSEESGEWSFGFLSDLVVKLGRDSEIVPTEERPLFEGSSKWRIEWL